MYIDDNLEFDIVECTSRFTINSAGRSPTSRRAEQRQRSVMRRQRTNPLRMVNDDGKLLSSPAKDMLPGEELSFYQGHSPQQSPRPCSPCTLCPEDAMMGGGELLPSESNTPNKHHLPIIPTIVGDAGQGHQSVAVSAAATLAYQRLRRPLADDHDTNSMDSGYDGASVRNELLGSQSDASSSCSSGTGLMRSGSVLRSISSTIMSRHSSSSSPSSRRLLVSSLSSGSMESMDDLELFDMETMQDEELGDRSLHGYQPPPLRQHHQPASGMVLPSGLNTLISGTIKTTRSSTTPETKRPYVRRCLSLTESTNKMNVPANIIAGAPAGSVIKTPEQFVRRLVAIEDQENCHLTPYSARIADATARCFKRPEPPGISPVQSKRCKMIESSPSKALVSSALDSPSRTTVLKTIYQKSISMNDEQIMNALSRSSSEPDLIGDFSKSYILPLMDGQHRDLKAISGETMARLVRGEFQQKVASFKIIDCRYPYEFEGGHIRGAKNLYTHEQIIEELIKSKTERPTIDEPSEQNGQQQQDSSSVTRRNIIVFHCEFSSERGPKLSRFLRNHDRILNSDSYPALHYPEVYLLHGGYKEFFKAHSSLCDPIAYRPMLDPDFGDAYRHFRAKSRSWNGDGTTTVKATKTRSRLML
ncbi:M-phase inducer phosphatase-like [Anopheles cruzii]|uniref:M-phase inducer phosphatase-like n=1 Tax=Anopheles cruzii TaxID=68878 RepID=UPI0022EC6808|nr:M-phase inducer phosphatase-like [Anopheles cruzii]